MKLHILSDLHTEFKDFDPPETDADVVILAGDITVKARLVEWAKSKFAKPVVCVAGNHDHYQRSSIDLNNARMKKQAEGTNVHFLQDSSVVIDGVRFIGATLWTDYKFTGNEVLAHLDVQRFMAGSDMKYIRDKQMRKITTRVIAEYHARSRFYIQDQLEIPFAGKTVVISHHSPTGQSIDEYYKHCSNHLNSAYASNLEHMMGEHLNLWVHGHMHNNTDVSIKETRVVCNPRGYAGYEINPDFNPALVVEI